MNKYRSRLQILICATASVSLIWAMQSADDVPAEFEAPETKTGIARGDSIEEVSVKIDINDSETMKNVSGTVIDTSGDPVAGALVAIRDKFEQSIAVRSNENGRFAITFQSRSNPAEIKVSATHFIGGGAKIAASESDIFLTLVRSGRLEGQAFDAEGGRPLAHFSISIYGDSHDAPTEVLDRTTVFNQQTGLFEIVDLRHQSIDILALADGYQPVIIHDFEVSDRSERLKLQFERGRSISGRVIAESDHQPISGAEVIALGDNPNLGLGARLPTPLPGKVVRTEADGKFTLTGLSDENLKLHVRADAYASQSLDTPFEDSIEVLVSLQAGGSISGQLVGLDGASPEDGSVRARVLQDGASRTVRSNENGQFEFRNLESGDYLLEGSSDFGYSNSMQLTLGVAENLRDVMLQIQPSNTLTGHISGLRQGEIALGVEAVRPGRLPLAKKVDEWGNYELRGVQTGVVEVVAKTSSGRSLSRHIEIDEGSNTYLDFVFDGAASIQGRISRSGEPLQNVRIVLAPKNDLYPRGVTYTSSDGAFVIDGLADAEYSLVIDGESVRSVNLGGRTTFNIDL